MLLEVVAAMVGTAAFGLLFGVPRRFYLPCALIGGAGWLVYLLTERASGREAGACLAASMVVVLLSRFVAIRLRCPVTIFLICGIIPLVPGGGVYWTLYYIVSNQRGEAVDTGYQALKNAIAIVIGIVFVFEVPQKWFLKLLRKDGL